MVKGLKDTYISPTRIHEKGPQTLADVISKVEKLAAAQQLTATLIPSSTVNVMSNVEDCCFQCQEAGHIACHCPNVWCFECDEYGHIIVDCPHRISPSRTPVCCHRSPSQHRLYNRLTSCQCHEDRYRCSRSRSQSHPCRYHSRGCHDSYRDHSRSCHRTVDAITGILPGAHTPMPIHITLTMTLHIRDCLCTEALQLTLESAADHDLNQHTNQPRRPHTKIHHDPGNPKVIHTLRETHRVTIDDPQMDFLQF